MRPISPTATVARGMLPRGRGHPTVLTLLATPLGLKASAGIVILAMWEFGTRWFAAPFVARPSAIARAFKPVLMDAALWEATWSTLFAVLIGLAISLVAGTLLGLTMGRIRVADRMLDFYVNGFYAMPMVAALPLLTMWFGYDEAARLATIVFAAFFSIVINVSDGARSVPREYLEVGRAYRASPRDIWFHITLMAAIPHLLAGIRLAAGRALVGAVLAEIFASIDGLGMFILANARAFQQNEAVVGVLLLAGFGIGFDALVNGLLNRYFPWYRRRQ